MADHTDSVPASRPKKRTFHPPNLMVLDVSPFDNWDENQMRSEIEDYLALTGLSEDRRYFELGGRLNLQTEAFNVELQAELSEEERTALFQEDHPKGLFSRFRQSRGLWTLVILCSAAAAVQGWDESAINGGEHSQKWF